MGKKLYVGNLPFGTTEAALNEMFAQAGSVTSARIITDRDSGRSKGFGFIEMATDEEAQNAISSFDGSQLEGRQIVVNEARPMERRNNDGPGFSQNSGPRSGGWRNDGERSRDGYGRGEY